MVIIATSIYSGDMCPVPTAQHIDVKSQELTLPGKDRDYTHQGKTDTLCWMILGQSYQCLQKCLQFTIKAQRQVATKLTNDCLWQKWPLSSSSSSSSCELKSGAIQACCTLAVVSKWPCPVPTHVPYQSWDLSPSISGDDDPTIKDLAPSV